MTQDPASSVTTPLDVARSCAALYSRVFSRLVTRHYNNSLTGTGLRVTQFSILNAIKLSPPNSIHELADLLGMERTSLQRTVEKLISMDLLASRSTGQNRSLGLSLTPKGEEVYEQALEKWTQAHREFTDLVGEDAWAMTTQQLRQFSSQLQSSLKSGRG